MSFDRLIENIVKTQNPSVVGLDPKLEYIPSFITDKRLKSTERPLKQRQKLYLSSTRALLTRYTTSALQ